MGLLNIRTLDLLLSKVKKEEELPFPSSEILKTFLFLNNYFFQYRKLCEGSVFKKVASSQAQSCKN